MKFLFLTIFVSFNIFAAEGELKNFKSNIYGYSVKYPSNWEIESGVPDDEAAPADSLYEQSFRSSECYSKKRTDCVVAIESKYPSVAKRSIAQARRSIGFKFKPNDEKLRTFNTTIRGSTYPALITKLDADGSDFNFRVSIYFDCEKEQIYKFTSYRKFSGDFKYFDGDEKSFQEKIISPVMRQFLDSFQCPSKEFLNSKKYKKNKSLF